MKTINTLIALLCLAANAFATQFTIYNDDDILVYTASGSLINEGLPDLQLRFGAFDSSFTATSDNAALWEANFYTGTGGGYIDNSEGYNEWSASFQIVNNQLIPVGAQLVLWVATSWDVGAGSEWLLLTDASWQAGVATLTDTNPQRFYITADTTAAFGSFNYVTATAQLASVSAVPEPATFAAFFGAVALGFCIWRRKRIR